MLRRFAILSLIVISCASAGAATMWTDVRAGDVPAASGTRWIVPDRARVVALDADPLERALSIAPDEIAVAAGATPPVIVLPLPDGSNRRFELVASPVMAPGLARRYPAIRTFIVRAVRDGAMWGRADLTPAGFHAMVFAGADTAFIDPYRTGDAVHHVVYWKRDLARDPARHDWSCQLDGASPDTIADDGDASLRALPLSHGGELREYRVAIAATGEYTQFHGGTVADGLAAIVTALNRVDGVYERETALRMILVANNDLVVYTDPVTDPYSNNNPGALLSENQSNLTSVIGSANFDIGHVVSTGGGGVAGLGVVCRTTSKGRGVTGLPSPTGDPFWIDYVAHEMGHQWGANHTFNGTRSACGGGNRNAATAYETGSGSTILAYAGICGSQNLQTHSDDYFHVASLDEIIRYTTLGVGDNCAATTVSGNTPPTADAGPGFTIPARTPFVLTGSGSDVDNDTLSYCWEQYDLGPQSPPDSDDGARPIMRSWNPTTDPTRTIPRLTDLVASTTATGETLATTDRDLTFQLTVRDNHAGTGGVATDVTVIAVTSGAGPFAITAPNTAITWTGSGPHLVTWDVAGTTAAPVACAAVDITLSTDGGLTHPVSLAAGTPNDGNEAITANMPDTADARVRVQCSDNIFFDISDADFTITGASDVLFADTFESGAFTAWSDAAP